MGEIYYKSVTGWAPILYWSKDSMGAHPVTITYMLITPIFMLQYYIIGRKILEQQCGIY